MPITLKPISRRQFLAGSLAVGAGLLAPRALARDDQDPHRFALLADTHIDANPQTIVRETNMFENLTQIVHELRELDRVPSGVLIDGDCAYLAGKKDDYATFFELLEPIRQNGFAIHIALGNHDHRGNFRQALRAGEDMDLVVEDRHVSLVPSTRANWFVLDSLKETNHTPGTLGGPQLAWLAQNLDLLPDKPAIIVLHHNPDESEEPSGLTDTRALIDLLAPRRQVKAVVFGHTHSWNVREKDGIHWINLPPGGYVFDKNQPAGWVDVRLGEHGATLELRCLDQTHPRNSETVDLEWRV